jgi:hypothetical protein
MSYRFTVVGLLFLTLVACSDRTKAQPRDNAAATADSAAPAHHTGMDLTARPMLPGFRAHLDSLAQPKMTHAAMTEHPYQVKHLVDAMHADMSMMGMPGDPAYEALADSAIKGSAELGRAGGADFQRRLRRHLDQLHRLTAAYESKTAAM